MRTKLIAGNWKMNKTPTETKLLLSEIIPLIKDSNITVVIAPSFLSLPIAAEMLKGTNIILAAQNMAEHDEGAYTGETSPLMLKDIGVKMVILGHSERRQYYNESDREINSKVKLALKHGLTVNLCIGETLQEREEGKAFEVVKNQLEQGLKDVTNEQMANVVIAYEPVWAIGTGKTATSSDAEAVHLVARAKIEALYSVEVAQNVVIQYGGSVNPGNVKELMAMPNIDGALVGGASLKAESFSALVNYSN